MGTAAGQDYPRSMDAQHKYGSPGAQEQTPKTHRTFSSQREVTFHSVSGGSSTSAQLSLCSQCSSPARAEVLPLIPFHNSILWADVCHATSAENGCSNQGPLQTLLLWHSGRCRSISVLSWAACKWLWIHRAPALVLNPLSKCLLRPLQASCCYSGRAALRERL